MVLLFGPANGIAQGLPAGELNHITDAGMTIACHGLCLLCLKAVQT
ncbi:hypothetical protein ACI6Q2_12265 [Chitinophagaceae bacterium LWZ2-11]